MAETMTDSDDIHTPEVPPPSVPGEPQPAQPNKRPVGRPRNDGLPAGSPKANGKAPAGPLPGEDGGAYDDFFAHLRTLPKGDWDEQLMLYLYRTHPILDLGKKGDWKIERYTKPIDAQDVMEAHGSGGYKILLVRWSPLTRQTTLLRTHYFRLLNMNYPPKVPFGAWLDREENKEWLWAKPTLEQQTRGASNGASADANLFQAAVNAVKELRPDVSNEDQTTLTKLVIETMKDANRQMLERADPSNTLQLVNTVVNAVAGKGSGESSAILTLVTAQLSSLREELAAERAFGRELLTKLTAPTGEKKSLKSEVTELAETMSALGYQRGGGKGGTDWGEAAVEIGKEVLKSLTALGTAIITKKPAQPNATQNQRPAPTIIEQPREIAGQAPAAPPAETTAPPEEAMNTIQTLSNQFGGLFDTAAPFLVDQFVKGFSGMEFREWFKETYGTFTYNAMRGMDPRTIADVIELRKTQSPEHVQGLLQQLQPHEELLTFITEFLSDAPVDEEEIEPPAPQEVPPPPTPITRKKPGRQAPEPPAAAAQATTSFVDPNAHPEF